MTLLLALDVEDRGLAPYWSVRAARQGRGARAGGCIVKYMLIIYGNQELWESLGPDVMAREFEAFAKFNKKFAGIGMKK